MDDELKSKVQDIKSIQPSTKSYYRLIDEYNSILAKIEANDGIIDEEILQEYEANEKDFKDKLIGLYLSIQYTQSKIDNIYKPEIKDLQARSKRLESNIDVFKTNVLNIVSIFGTIDKKTNALKIVTDKLNCSRVELDVLDTDNETYNNRVNSITEYINEDDQEETISDEELSLFTTSINFNKLSIYDAHELIQLIKGYGTPKMLESFTTSLSLDRKETLNLMKSRRDILNNDPNADVNTEPIIGATISVTKYPRFS